ncbi:MAG: ABC transporter substrate binding protein, partial [bacterium]
MSLIERRRFLSGASAFLALAAAGVRNSVHAQRSPPRPYRIALVPDFGPSAGEWGKSNVKILTDSLREWGRIEGRDYVFYYSGVQYGPETKLAVDRVMEAKPDLMIVLNLGYALDAHKRTKTIPIVLWAGGFPVETGVAKSLAKPGMNVTGCMLFDAEGKFFGKLVDLLHQTMPSMKRVGFFMTYIPPFHPRVEADLISKGVRDAATALGIDLRVFEISNSAQVDEALAQVDAQGIEGLVFTSDPVMSVRRNDIMKFTVAKRLPTIGDTGGWLRAKPQSLLVYQAPLDALLK